MSSKDDDDKKRRKTPRRYALYVACVVVFVLLVLNFDARTGDWGTDRVVKSTPDQMYVPSFRTSDTSSSSFGVIYAANGPFLKRAFESALALGRGANATIFSDANGTRECATLNSRSGDRINVECRAVDEERSSWGFRSAKLWAFTATPYDKTLYMDADAFPCASYDWLRTQLVPALERYDVMAAHSSFRRGMPYALHWLNAGVIAFDSRSRPARSVFATWLRDYENAAAASESKIVTDQRLFNEAVLYSEGLRAMALPPEFNCKSNYKSVRFQWAKYLSPALFRKVRKNYQCCKIPSVGDCVIDHECQFPPSPQIRRRP